MSTTSSENKHAFQTPYAAEARYRNSQHMDFDPTIGKLIQENRKRFEEFVVFLGQVASSLGVPDSSEYTRAIEHIEVAKDAMGRALIHAIGSVQGTPFELAVQASCMRPSTVLEPSLDREISDAIHEEHAAASDQ